MATYVWDAETAADYDAASPEMFDPALLGQCVDVLAALAGGGPAVEFAVGTGRVALPLSARGVQVSGIELSPHMAEQLRAKPGADAVPVTVGDMTTARVDGTFTLVYLVFNTIENVTTQDEQIAVFANAAAHLAPGGRFVVEVEVPSIAHLPSAERGRVLQAADADREGWLRRRGPDGLGGKERMAAGARMAAMVTDAVASVLDALAVRLDRVAALKDVALGNGSWLVEMPGGQRAVLRRYHPGASREDLAYEHAVLGHLAAAGWVVPHPVGDPVCHDGLWYCLTRHVPGQPAARESRAQRRRRGRDLARLDLALRGLGQRIGQRPGWRPQHSAVTANAGIDWQACVRQLTAVSPRLAAWAQAAAGQTRAALADIGAGELLTTVIHGDFAEWNVHYQNGQLAGVIDFGLAHQDSRPYELAIARTYRAPETADAYRSELGRSGWPLSELEEAAITPVYHAFRLDMAAWEIGHGLRTGEYNLTAIERQLSMTGTPAL